MGLAGGRIKQMHYVLLWTIRLFVPPALRDLGTLASFYRRVSHRLKLLREIRKYRHCHRSTSLQSSSGDASGRGGHFLAFLKGSVQTLFQLNVWTLIGWSFASDD